MKRPEPPRRLAAAASVVAALLALSGCFKASHDVAVRADGSGSVTVHVDVDKGAAASLLRSFAGLGGSSGPVPGVVEPFKPVDRTFPDGTRVRSVDTPDRATLDASFDFADPDDYKRKLQQVSQAISNNPDASLPDDGSLDIRRVGDRLDVALDVGPSLAGAGDVDFAAVSRVLDPDDLPELVVTITMPGAILDTNGVANGRTVTWDLLSRSAPSTLTVSSRVARAGLPGWAVPVGVGLVVVLLLALLGVLVGQRRRPVAAAEPEATPRPGTATFFPPPPGLPPPPQAGWPTPQAVEPPARAAAPPREAWPTRSGPEEGAPVTPGQEPASPSGSAAPAEEVGPSGATPGVAPEAGWYSDPAGSGGWRYWDGSSWTSHTS